MKYYVANGQTPTGPFEIATLRQMNIMPSTLLWNDSLPGWTRADHIEEVRSLVLGNTYSQPQPQPQSYGYDDNTKYNDNFTDRSAMPPCPPNYLVLAIITVLFSLLFGILALIYSNKVKKNYNNGDYEAAQKASKTTLIMSIIGLVIGCFGTFSILFV